MLLVVLVFTVFLKNILSFVNTLSRSLQFVYALFYAKRKPFERANDDDDEYVPLRSSRAGSFAQ
jgi:hypothetical protein